jgi:hypothetical protein
MRFSDLIVVGSDEFRVLLGLAVFALEFPHAEPMPGQHPASLDCQRGGFPQRIIGG